jgi:hypothetical protein
MLALNKITLTIPMGTAEFPVAVIASACGIPLALLVFFTSSFKDKPIYWPVRDMSAAIVDKKIHS